MDSYYDGPLSEYAQGQGYARGPKAEECERRPFAFTVTAWHYHPEWDEPLRNGFTRGDAESKHALRLGPFAIAFGRDPK